MDNLQTQIENLRTLQQSYDQLGAAAEAYNTGKVELAANITAKGVPASATETIPELAGKVSAIAQQPIILSPSEVGDMYAKQLYGALTTPNYWNLYEVLNTLLNDGRLLNYGGILLAEYYKGYDSLALSGAGAGGAYVVSDMENGQFKMYTNDTTHTWATEDDGHGNRWVAYCFADEYHDFQITDTDKSPRSIFIGRKVGTITSLVNGRASQIVIPDGNELYNIFQGGYSQNFGGVVIVRNIKSAGRKFLNLQNNTEIAYVQCSELKTGDESYFYPLIMGGSSLNMLILDIKSIIGNNNAIATEHGLSKIKEIVISNVENCTGKLSLGCSDGQTYPFFKAPELKCVRIVQTEELYLIIHPDSSGYLPNLTHIYAGYKENNKSKTVTIDLHNLKAAYVDDMELQDGWCKPLVISSMTKLTKENVQAHIFGRLGVNDLSTGTVTITLASAVLALFTQEEIDAVVARTNITIVGV